MPGISGIETVRRLRERERKAVTAKGGNGGGWYQPVFLLTANTNDKSMIADSSGLVNGVVDKQTQVPELLRLARSAAGSEPENLTSAPDRRESIADMHTDNYIEYRQK